jgi:phage shock protein PspC (stress-responsive transcriptional regulator)
MPLNARQLHPESGGGLQMNRRLYRSRRDSVLGGVAGGVAEYLDVDPSIVRIIWAVLAIVTGGLFILLYIVMWIVVPEGAAADPATPPDGAASAAPSGQGWVSAPPRRRGGSNGTLVVGLLLIGAGIWFLIDEYLPAVDRRFVWPVALVVLGLILLLIAVRRPRSE